MSAFFMDIVTPKIAATQFTAFMAMSNLAITYSYWWEGKAMTPAANGGWGLTYLQIFLIDAAIGALFLIPLSMMRRLDGGSAGNSAGTCP